MSLERTWIRPPKSWCLPRTHCVNSTWPLSWGQGLSGSAFHQISFPTSATEVHCSSGTVLHHLPHELSTPERLRCSPWSAAWGRLASWRRFSPQSCWDTPPLGGPSSNHPNSNAEYSLKLWWPCSRHGMLRLPWVLEQPPSALPGQGHRRIFHW